MGGDRVYTEEELAKEKPKGELMLKNEKGDVHKVFICHGCQSCLMFTDDTLTELEQSYPHFLSVG